ncbi:hypothetical protein HAX54_025740 [Datura stramonium]|uniref:Uncharacterized protein n=1 Tax=Datura stramonium TaxID=4076 RepID=A0ABS8V264_DATST|nr:hypothetical protein [Datura stramonium]
MGFFGERRGCDGGGGRWRGKATTKGDFGMLFLRRVGAAVLAVVLGSKWWPDLFGEGGEIRRRRRRTKAGVDVVRVKGNKERGVRRCPVGVGLVLSLFGGPFAFYMEECKIEKSSIKRSQKDSEPESAESKRVRIVEEAVFNSPELYRVNLEANPHFSGVGDLDASLGLYSLEAKHIREDILDILDDQQTLTDRVPEVQDLNSVMKSLEEEIVLPLTQPAQQIFLDLMLSYSGDPQPDLGYL